MMLSIMLYIHCNFPSNIKIAFIITHVKALCVAWGCGVWGICRTKEKKAKFVISSTTHEHNFMYLKERVKKGARCR